MSDAAMSGCLLKIVAGLFVFGLFYLSNEQHAKFERATMGLIRYSHSEIQAARKAAESGASPESLARRLREIEGELSDVAEGIEP